MPELIGVHEDGARRSAHRQMEQVPAKMVLTEVTRNFKQVEAERGTWMLVTTDSAWRNSPADNGPGSEIIPSAEYLVCMDNGPGMNSQQMGLRLGCLWNSGGSDVEKKHGIGARLTGLRASPECCRWTSLRNGKISALEIWTEDGQIHREFLFQDELVDDDFLSLCFPPIRQGKDGAFVSNPIVEAGHGTLVELPAMNGLVPRQYQAIVVELWQRWLDGPANTQIGVRGYSPAAGHFEQHVGSLRESLNSTAEIVASVDLPDDFGVARIYVLPKTTDDLKHGEKSSLSGLFKDKKPVARTIVAMDGEVYVNTIAGGAFTRLRHFGLVHGNERVVLVLECNPAKVMANELRTDLVLRNSTGDEASLPFDAFADHVRANMPDEIRNYMSKCQIGNLNDEQRREFVRLLFEETTIERVTVRKEVTTPPKKHRKKKDKTDRSDRGNRTPRIKNAPGLIYPRVEFVSDPVKCATILDPVTDKQCSACYVPTDDDAPLVQINLLWPPFKTWSIGAAQKFDLDEKVAEDRMHLSIEYIVFCAVNAARMENQPPPSAFDFNRQLSMPQKDIVFRLMNDMYPDEFVEDDIEFVASSDPVDA